MTNTGAVAILCEGAFEQAVMEILLENDKLIFSRNDLWYGEILRCRSAKNFQSDYLGKSAPQTLTVYRILDSKKENFKLSGPYRKRVSVVNIITAPEIEMLVILALDQYQQYSHKKKKPSDFVKEDLKLPEVKSYRFVKNFFSDVNLLINSIEKYHQNRKKHESTLYDLIKK